MFFKNIKFLLILFLLYQNPLHSKSASFDDFDSKNLSKYFSGIVAFENKNNSKALNFFNTSKILLNKHEPYLKRYVFSLVLEDKVNQAINVIKQHKDKSEFFEKYLLLTIDSLRKDEFSKALDYISETKKYIKLNRFDSAILDNLRDYIFVFNEKRLPNDIKNYGNLSIISTTFQRCYLGDPKTKTFFSKLINNNDDADLTRYTFFYLSYLIESNQIEEAKKITDDIRFINTSLLLSQGKSWIENGNEKKMNTVFSCKNHNDLISEFLFLISNLYSAQDDFIKSNFYLFLSNYLNPKFYYNLSLLAENQYSNKEFNHVKKILREFEKEDDFYYWYRLKKEAQIISKEINQKESLKFIKSNFEKIEKPNEKILYDIANFYRNAEEYENAIKYYTKVLGIVSDDLEIKSDLFYRRGASNERMGNYEEADRDMLLSLEIDPDDAYVLNYLAYSWLERDHKIKEAMEMLEKAYSLTENDPYIIDSIGWAYFLTDDYVKAETYLKRAVELMPDDAIVNDHYGDILWKLGRKIQARYFWKSVSKMEDVDEELLQKINQKIIKGL
ncbi:tetratricopeptide repeat protein [Candidatus Pelagibacter sp.]|uniref:tetratricopeptide repeat protein n=1 Tax=Candidatus Pelagibacter sp. TaxID=2024849 RepID=UPI003F853834